MTGTRDLGRRRCAAWLGVFALLFQSWLSLVHHPAMLFAAASRDGAELSALTQFFGEAPVLCGDVGAARHDVPPADKAPVHHPPPCPLCQSLHVLGSFVPPGDMVLALGNAAALRYRVWPNAPGIFTPLHRGARPRAPPSSV